METEEFEQIPWASLVAEQDDGVDKRLYLAVGLVGLLVIAVFGMRLVGGGAQPTPPQDAALSPQPSEPIVTPSSLTPPTSVVISEADLRAVELEPLPTSDHLTEVTAEWFVTDWFTRDGSAETVRSVRSALAPTVVVGALPHDDVMAVTFVEWAKALESETTTEGVEVTVAYRMIRQTDDGFVREPVATVVVELKRDGDDVTVVSLPEG